MVQCNYFLSLSLQTSHFPVFFHNVQTPPLLHPFTLPLLTVPAVPTKSRLPPNMWIGCLELRLQTATTKNTTSKASSNSSLITCVKVLRYLWPPDAMAYRVYLYYVKQQAFHSTTLKTAWGSATTRQILNWSDSNSMAPDSMAFVWGAEIWPLINTTYKMRYHKSAIDSLIMWCLSTQLIYMQYCDKGRWNPKYSFWIIRRLYRLFVSLFCLFLALTVADVL